MTFLPLAFQAFSAFYYNFKFLNLTEGQSLATVRETIEHFCTRSWEDVCSPRWEAVGKLHEQRGPGVGEEEREPGPSCTHPWGPSLLMQHWERGSQSR